MKPPTLPSPSCRLHACNALQSVGMCTVADEASCTITSVTLSGDTITGKPDACTLEGVDTGTSTVFAQPALAAGQCLFQANCTSGQMCVTTGATRQACSCVDGSNVCYPVGTCTNYCSLPSVTASLAALNTVSSCDPTAAVNPCSGGNTCQASSSCFTWACNATSQSLAYSACANAGVCVPTTPSLTSSVLSNNGRTITVTLGTTAATISATPAYNVFDDDTAAKLGGAGASVSASGTTVTITLPPTASVANTGSDVLVLKTGTSLQDAYGRAFRGQVTVSRSKRKHECIYVTQQGCM